MTDAVFNNEPFKMNHDEIMNELFTEAYPNFNFVDFLHRREGNQYGVFIRR